MPQFDLNILNTQNVNIFSFTISYLYYLKSILYFLYFFFKYPYKLLMNMLLYILNKVIYLYDNISKNYFMILPFLINLRLFSYFWIWEIEFIIKN